MVHFTPDLSSNMPTTPYSPLFDTQGLSLVPKMPQGAFFWHFFAPNVPKSHQMNQLTPGISQHT